MTEKDHEDNHYTAQIYDCNNTARAMTLIVAGHDEATARAMAAKLVRTLPRRYALVDFYPTPRPNVDTDGRLTS